MAEVSDSIHLRRFCRISLSERVPDESTVRKLTRRIGAETVNELTRALIVEATRSKRFRARAVQDRFDGDRGGREVPDRRGSGGARGQGARAGRPQAREAGRGAEAAGAGSLAVDGSHAAGGDAHDPAPLRRGEVRGAEVDRADRRAAGAARSPRRRRLAAIARRRARGRGAKAKLKAAAQLEQLADRCEKVATQIKQRVAGEPINDRLVSLADPDARPIRKGKLGKPNEFGYVTQLAEVTENTRRGARGLIVPAATDAREPGRGHAAAPDTIAELERLGISPREVALDGGFNVGPTRQALEDLAPERVFISGRQQPGSKRTQRRMQRYRTGAEGRISHLKRGYGMDRSRLKGDEGQQIWTGWSILAYNADTLAIRTR